MVTCLENLDKCNAECCKIIPFKISHVSGPLHVWLVTRGAMRVGNWYLLRCVCPRLSADNTCSIHGLNIYPTMCGYFVGQKEDYWIPENCIYANKSIKS